MACSRAAATGTVDMSNGSSDSEPEDNPVIESVVSNEVCI